MEQTVVQIQNPEQVRKNHNRRLIFYHANPKGTGSAAQFELRLNREGEDRYDRRPNVGHKRRSNFGKSWPCTRVIPGNRKHLAAIQRTLATTPTPPAPRLRSPS